MALPEAKSPAGDPAPSPGPAALPGRRRVPALLLIAGVVVLSAAAVGAHWLFIGRFVESTDNAYVGGDTVQVGAQVAGQVAEILVDETDQVQAGQVLVRLDPAEARIAVARAEADLALAVRQVRQQFAEVARQESTVTMKAAALRRTEADVNRREHATVPGLVSEEELAHARSAVAAARADLDSARVGLQVARAAVDGVEPAAHPLVLASAARLRQAALDEARTVIRAPIAGQVVKRVVQPGVRVQPGTPLLAVVALDRLWVEANFKEGQLGRLRPGLPVELTSDLHGGAVAYRGRVVDLGAGTGAAFALLPPQNASGNWIKVVQRLPVRIRLEPDDLAAHPLRIGLSMTARVRLDAAPVAVASLPARILPAEASAAATEARIQAIISANLGSLAAPAPGAARP